jgi:hypothetical protein
MSRVGGSGEPFRDGFCRFHWHENVEAVTD